jgi:hypothetical protein
MSKMDANKKKFGLSRGRPHNSLLLNEFKIYFFNYLWDNARKLCL